MIIKTPQSTALEIVVEKINTALDCNIVIGPLPEAGGIAAEVSGGANKGRYLNIEHGKEQLTVLFLCKNTSQFAAFDALNAIANELKSFSPVNGDNVYVMGVEMRSGVGLVGNDGGFYVYSMIVGIDIFF